MHLYLEEAGRRRGFRLKPGSIVVGSGTQAQLRLASPEVAQRHARLEVTADPDGRAGPNVRLIPEPGVVAPKMDGVQVPRDGVRMQPGRRIQIGGALLWIEADEAQVAAAKAAAAEAARPKTTVVPRARSISRRHSTKSKTGMPLWAMSGIAVLAIGALLLLVWRGLLISAEQAAPLSDDRLVAAQAHFRAGRLDEAQSRLDRIDGGELDPEELAEMQALQSSIEEIRAQTALYLDSKESGRLLAWMKEYEADSLSGRPELKRVRLFLKRAEEFRERYPTHPELDWVERQESRFAGTVDLNAPPDWPSVQWEARSFVRGLPRNYAAAFALVEEFLSRTAEGQERDEATRYLRLLGVERREHHEDRMQVAREQFEKGQAGRAVWWLVHQVIWSGETELADEAARVLVKMPQALEHLRGYREDEPEKFAGLMEHPRVQAFFLESESNG